jgi:alpha-amylase
MRVLLLPLLACAVACGVPPPDRLEIVPPTPIKSIEQGKTFPLKVQAFRGIVAHDENKAPLAVTWKSSDTTVADVGQDGTVTTTGSGKAVITANVTTGKDTAISATVDVENVFVSTVEATGEFPKPFKLSSKPVTLTVVVKDEKGTVIEKPRLKFSASDYCVEVSPDGVVGPLAVGECSVIVESAGKRASIALDVKE